MTLREWIFLLLGTGVGAVIGPLSRRLSSIDFSRQGKPVAASRVQGTDVEAETPSPAPESSIQERLEVEIPGLKIKITTRRLVAVVAVLLTAVAAWLIAGRIVKPPEVGKPVPSVEETAFRDMERGRVKERYSVEPHPNEEVVSGYKGRYYYVDLTRADSQRTLLFRPSEYIKEEFSDDFRTSMNAFRSDILRHIESSKIPYLIFVRGSADKSGDDAEFLASLSEGKARQIVYLPMLPEDPNRYSSQELMQEIPRYYANRHLPYLRAAYVQDKLQALRYDATILEGSVTNQVNERDRCAIMLLYVNWPEKILEAQDGP